MNNRYRCQRCGALKYNWSENLCPKCLEIDRLRREWKKTFGMRATTKEERQRVNEYISNISQGVYTEDEVITMFENLRQAVAKSSCFDETVDIVDDLVQERIDTLRGGKNE